MNILIKYHALINYKKRAKSTKNWEELRKELRELFKELVNNFKYKWYIITHNMTYGLKNVIEWGDKKIIYLIEDNSFILITYIEKDLRKDKKAVKKHKKKIKTDHKHKYKR